MKIQISFKFFFSNNDDNMLLANYKLYEIRNNHNVCYGPPETNLLGTWIDALRVARQSGVGITSPVVTGATIVGGNGGCGPPPIPPTTLPAADD
ncbi:hypothetical protein DERF_011222 [Dermatophagoides farinae]|uniref:Uncharacterized protein n=1 Tax=Dermatophagoides farinae TaxID=6954 RepID=A0A922HWP4_DERFA|nr:hypothetical protein DERF_011222 [Dermatophagoides farinae]